MTPRQRRAFADWALEQLQAARKSSLSTKPISVWYGFWAGDVIGLSFKRRWHSHHHQRKALPINYHQFLMA